MGRERSLGSYYLDADSLHFEAQLLDGQTGLGLIVALQPSVGLAREKTQVVEQLRQRVMAGLSMVLGSEFDTWQAASLPPTYEAYQEMLAAKGSGFEFTQAADHLAGRPQRWTPRSPAPRPHAP